ncbi:hypothetical protein [Roseateles sp. MS654]|uniref:hypothetical protein n=1 Tax=Roseateles sp. MS654 TaxID=3412685 RepID=UPI003C2DC3B2
MPVSVKTGDVAPASMGLDDCEALGSANTEARDELTRELEKKQSTSGLNEEEQAVLDKARGTGMTFSSASSKVPNAVGSYTGCSSGMAREKVPDLVGEGGTSAQKMGLNKTIRSSDDHEHDDAKDAAGVLCDKSHVHPGGGAGAHAEPKIVNDLTNLVGAENMRGGSMLFNIDWRSAKYGRSGMPCAHCFKMLCHAAKECDIRIFVCSHDNQPVELSKNDCGGDKAYADLSRRVDGGPVPGR